MPRVSYNLGYVLISVSIWLSSTSAGLPEHCWYFRSKFKILKQVNDLLSAMALSPQMAHMVCAVYTAIFLFGIKRISNDENPSHFLLFSLLT